MKLLNILPKEEKFYTMMQSLARCAHQASYALHHWVENPDEAVHAKCRKEIDEAKQVAKDELRTTVEEVCRTFITPFDREDIQELCTQLFLIPKLIGKIADRMELHHMEPMDKDINRFTRLLVAQADAMTDLMKGLVDGLKPNLINAKASALYELEDQGDEVFSDLIGSLFATERPARELILRKDLYELLEDVVDCYRDAAAVGLRIVLKHS